MHFYYFFHSLSSQVIIFFNIKISGIYVLMCIMQGEAEEEGKKVGLFFGFFLEVQVPV